MTPFQADMIKVLFLGENLIEKLEACKRHDSVLQRRKLQAAHDLLKKALADFRTAYSIGNVNPYLEKPRENGSIFG